MKRILIIIAVIIVLLGVGGGVYFFFFSQKTGLAVTPSTNNFPNSTDDTSTQVTPSNTQELGVPVSGAGTEVAPRLIRISDRPVAVGANALFVPGVVATSSRATTTGTTAYLVDPDVRISYIERESGNVYTFTAHGRTLTRTSNKTLPGIQDAQWQPDGSRAFVRFLEKTGTDEHVSTFALPSTGEGGYLLENNLEQAFVTGSSTLITLFTSANGSSATISNTLGTNIRTLFTSPLGALRLSSGGGLTVATTKAGAKRDGYAFVVDTKSGAFTRILGPLSGLTTSVSPSGRYVLYSFLDRGVLSLAVFDMTARSATRLPLATLPEKCAWSSDGNSLFCGVPTSLGGQYPDDWYQGSTLSSDRLWRIDMANRVATQLIDPKTVANVDIDVIAPAVDATSDVLIFTNKRDKTFWMYDL